MEEGEEHPLEKLLSTGEGVNAEFKQTLNNEYKIAKTICSFANTTGGVILIGIGDNKLIYGVDPEEEKYFLQKAASLHCKPPVEIKVEEIYLPSPEDEIDEKVVLIVTIPESLEKPHYAETKNGNWIPYLRKHDQNIAAGETGIISIRKKNT